MRKELFFDYVIIGSGAGGGVVASRLAELIKEGATVALLEWGGHFSKVDNTQKEIAMASRYYFESGGVMNRQRTMTFALARALGGSTTVYTGTSLTLPESVVSKWDIPGLTMDDLTPRFERYKLENNVHFLQESELNLNNKLFRDSCRKLGWSHSQFPVNVRGCLGSSTCNLGCPNLAKQGTAVVQIPLAAKQGVQVITWCEVEEIQKNALLARIHPAKYGLLESEIEPGEYLIHAKKIIISAGAFGTPALLLRSKNFRDLPAIGRYLTCHPGLMIAGKHSQSIGSPLGHPKSFYCDEFLETEGFLLESCMYFPFTFSKNTTCFGEGLDQFMQDYDRLQMILSLGMDKPDPRNRVIDGKDGSFQVDYEISSAVKKSLLFSIARAAEILFESGADLVHSLSMQKSFYKCSERRSFQEDIKRAEFITGKIVPSAAHLMGTCRMGVSAEESVTDPWGRVFGHDHLYIADASLFPMASEVNPYLTVMALADRVADAVILDTHSKS